MPKSASGAARAARLPILAAALSSLMLTALPGPAGAADGEGAFVVEGVGRAPCEGYVKVREEQSPQYLNFGGWVEGYLTAYNQLSDDTYDITAFESIELLAALLDRYCRNFPQTPFFTAVARMVRELEPSRLRARSERVTVENGGRKVQIYEAVMKQAQEALKAAGFYDGAVDGAYGPKTRAALESFQKARGIEQTGLPDQVTLLRLLRDASAARAPAPQPQ